LILYFGPLAVDSLLQAVEVVITADASDERDDDKDDDRHDGETETAEDVFSHKSVRSILGPDGRLPSALQED
jgi:hypothetical protein